MSNNIHGFSKTDSCAYLFRKQRKSDLCTEAALEPDMELVMKMCELGIRVQDLLTIEGSFAVDELTNWFLTRPAQEIASASATPEKYSDTDHKSLAEQTHQES